MGCDIHMYVEYKRKTSKEEKWENGDYFRLNPYHNEEDEPKYNRLELHGNRNYTLFSTLAGVRDYTDQVKPVAEEKGMPNDCSEYVKDECKSWEGDGHSHSWLTLKELKDYQAKNPVMFYTGLLSPQQQLDLDNGIMPQSWCQGTNQEGFKRRDWQEENKSLIPLIKKLQDRAKELLGNPWQDYNIDNDENIRIVFWFDN
jgi:hypothetical protein